MKEIYVLSDSVTGRIKESNKINREWDSKNLDGSTVTERIERVLSENQDYEVTYFPIRPLPDPETFKIVVGNIVTLSETELSEQKSEKEAEEQRLAEIKAEKKVAGFEKISVANAWGKIDKLFENKTTVAQVKTACIKAFKLLIVLLLK